MWLTFGGGQQRQRASCSESLASTEQLLPLLTVPQQSTLLAKKKTSKFSMIE
jgi:hypothetical protein